MTLILFLKMRMAFYYTFATVLIQLFNQNT